MQINNKLINIRQRDIITGNSPVKCGYKIDGSDVYVKRIYLGYLPNAGSKSVAHGISNFGLIVDIRGVTKDVTTGAQSKLPYVITSVSSSATQYFTYQVGFDVSDTDIIVYTGRNRTSNQAWVDLFFIYAS